MMHQLLLPTALFFRGYLLTREAPLLRSLLLGCFLLAGCEAWAQQPQTNPADLLSARFLPKSPTVSEFQRFDTQQLVDMPSGAARLSVPLAEISSGPLQASVSLAYSYTGLQVGQPLDLVGLGWSLQAGASITRQVNGLVDGSVTGEPYNVDSISRKQSDQRFLKKVYKNYVDSGPDIYSFFLPDGTTGRFVIIDTSLVLLPQQPLVIRRFRSSDFGGWGFQIATEDGVRYQFQNVEVTYPNPHNFGPVGMHVSGWQLSRIISTDNADTVRFAYTNSFGYERQPLESTLTTGRYYTGLYEDEGEGPDPMGKGYACGSTADYSYRNTWMYASRLRAQYLESITTRHARILVQRNAVHEINRVRLVSTSNGLREIKRFDFYQSPFNQYHPTVEDTLGYRLRLDSLRESANGIALPAYTFHYNEVNAVPSRKSAAKDYWGYFNGAFVNGDFNTTISPTLLADSHLSVAGIVPADREPHYQYTEAGALEQVDYPTGGSTRWEYEPGRLACEWGDIPISKTFDEVGPTTFDAANTATLPNGRIPFTPSDKIPFSVAQKDTVTVWLTRVRSPDNDRLQDFNIWKKGITSDSLVTMLTNSSPSYKMANTETRRKFTFLLPAGQYVAQLYCEKNDSSLTLTLTSTYRDSTLLRLGLPGPGVRVKSTTTAALGAPAIVRHYQYTRNGFCAGVSLLPGFGKAFERYPFDIVTRKLLFEGTTVDPTVIPVVTTRCHFIGTSSNTRLLEFQFSKLDYYYSQVNESTDEDQGITANRLVPK